MAPEEEELLLSETSHPKFFQSAKNPQPCINCKKKAKYECPRCHVHYCELACYKLHDLECTEDFYKDQVIQHLKRTKANESEIQKMKKLLHKYKEKEAEEDTIEIDEKILKKQISRLKELKELIDQDELTIEKLTIEEQKDFQSFIEKTKENWKVWKPYWWNEDSIPSLLLLENEIDDNFSDEIQTKSEQKLKAKRISIKARIDKLPDFKALTQKKAVNIELLYHFINILYGSCFNLRLFNGDLFNNAEDSMGLLMNISKCLFNEPRCVFGSIDNSILNAIEASVGIEGQSAKDLISILLEDLAQVFKNKFFAFEIMFKIYDLCHSLGNSEDDEKRKIMNKIKHKLIFFMSFYKSEISFSQMESFRLQMKDFIKEMEERKTEAQTLGFYKKLNLLL